MSYLYFDNRGDAPVLSTEAALRARVSAETGGKAPRGQLPVAFCADFDFTLARVLDRPDPVPHHFARLRALPEAAGDGEAVVGWDMRPIVPTVDDLNLERDKRIAAGFEWSGRRFQADPESLDNIAGVATSAVAAMLAGVDPDDTYWNGGAAPFGWLDMENTYVVLSAARMVEFGNAALAHKAAHIFAARALKGDGTGPLPPDYVDGKYWP